MKITDIDGGQIRSKLTSPTPFPSAGLLVLRLVVGVTFLVHGIDKLGDLSGTERFLNSLDIPAPAVMAPFVAVTEAVGGALLIAGLATPLAAAALAIDMLVALITVHIGKSFAFFVSDGGIELELLIGGACGAIVLAGAGRFSLDAAFERTRRLSRPGAVTGDVPNAGVAPAPVLLEVAVAVTGERGTTAINSGGEPR